MESAVQQFFLIHITAFVSDEFNQDFWNYYLPRLTQRSLPVWHASIALASSTWSRRNLSPDNTTLRRETIKHYILAIKATLVLTKSTVLTLEDMTVILATNIVFAILSFQNGDEETLRGIMHNTRKLIRQWKIWKYIDTPLGSELVVCAVFFFIKQGKALQDAFLVSTGWVADTWGEAIATMQTRPLATLSHAYVEVEMIWSSAHSTLNGLPMGAENTCDKVYTVAAAESARSELHRQFLIWEARYEALLASLDGARTDSVEVDVLGIRRLITSMLLKVDLRRFVHVWDETCWDALEPDFVRLVNVAEATLARECKRAGDPLRSKSTVWHALHFAMRFCRVPTLRRRALAVLRRSVAPRFSAIKPAQQTAVPWLYDDIFAREEGAWERCREVDGCVRGEFICNWHRVKSVDVVNTLGPSQFRCLTVEEAVTGRSRGTRPLFLHVPIWK